MLPPRDNFDFEFTRVPASGPAKPTYTITRAPESGSISGIVLSEKVEGTNTHWTGTQTMGCVGENCPYCAAGRELDWHCYFFLYGRKSNKIILFEVTRGPLQALLSYEDSYGTIRGASATIGRRKKRKNAPVVVEMVPSNMPKEMLPPCPDLKEALKRIWSGGRWQKKETADEVLDAIEQRTFAHGVLGVETIVDEVLKKTRLPKGSNGVVT